MISFVWAMDQNGVIGKNNSLPWHLPADLKFFKETTMGHPIVMGRKTYESIGKPLPGRENIVLTRDASYKAEGCIVFHEVEDILHYADEKEVEVMVTGGAEVFKMFLPFVDRLYVTKIYASFEGDTYIPKIPWEKFSLISNEKGPRNEKNPYDYEFQIYESK
ncbi:dihydrofolate reductase [Bacillus pakistanensis]|uniref:Dihydrofolate reductase n=1 Tax=Rossellomorea pakistanensis TaxID=992288 RepID=A0ABS2N8R7_9BACI|nr:dihydrofolate reductase [Bacillus pakistanensis]MBM7584255.1 dihydrofolate reductase [Bacillus pakistanensis]